MSLRRWVNGSWGTSNSGGVTGLGGSLHTPSAVEEMAEDAVTESDGPEQEREREESGTER